MTPDERLQLTRAAERVGYLNGPGFDAVALLSKVVLELDANQRRLEFPLTATATATSGTAFQGVSPGGSGDGELSNSPAFSVVPEDAGLKPRGVWRRLREGPITAEELEHRGTDAELEARAIDVILRCGWPDRKRHRVNVEPCVPVPVSVLESMRRDLEGGFRNLPKVADAVADLLIEQDRIQGLYAEALPDAGPLPERAHS